jgi:large subunit ribosomal protein L21
VSYAIIESGGKQFRVTEGQIVRVPSLHLNAGTAVEFNALLKGNGREIEIGGPSLDGASVRGKVLEHGRGIKVIVFKKKRKKQYKKTIGHRQGFTSVLIESIGGAADLSKNAASENADKTEGTHAAASAPEEQPTPVTAAEATAENADAAEQTSAVSSATSDREAGTSEVEDAAHETGNA